MVETMSEYKHTKEFLKQLQSLPLEEKMLKTQARGTEWYVRFRGGVLHFF